MGRDVKGKRDRAQTLKRKNLCLDSVEGKHHLEYKERKAEFRL